MELPFALDGVNLLFFLGKFGLGEQSFLKTLQTFKAVATGVDLILMLTGRWGTLYGENPRSLHLVVLCSGAMAREGLRERFVKQERYRRSVSACRHELMEWAAVPKDKVDCFVQGELSQRVIHVVELPRSPIEVVLSRTYGSMAGTYLKGNGVIVSLFPRSTFEQRVCWFPSVQSVARKQKVQRLYPGWHCDAGSDSSVIKQEVGASFRNAGDPYCWVIEFAADGGVRSSREPVSCR